MDSGESSERRDAKGKSIALEVDLNDPPPGEIMDTSNHLKVEVEGQGNGNFSGKDPSSFNVTGGDGVEMISYKMFDEATKYSGRLKINRPREDPLDQGCFNQLGDLYASPHDKRAITLELKIDIKSSIGRDKMNQDITINTLAPPIDAPSLAAPLPV